MGEALELLLGRQEKRDQTALGQRETSRRLERKAPLRDVLGLGEIERPTTKTMAQVTALETTVRRPPLP